MEKNYTKTEHNISLAIKLSFFQFLNAGVFLVLANIAADYQNFNLHSGITY